MMVTAMLTSVATMPTMPTIIPTTAIVLLGEGSLLLGFFTLPGCSTSHRLTIELPRAVRVVTLPLRALLP